VVWFQCPNLLIERDKSDAVSIAVTGSEGTCLTKVGVVKGGDDNEEPEDSSAPSGGPLKIDTGVAELFLHS
jgi:hypothetical protein